MRHGCLRRSPVHGDHSPVAFDGPARLGLGAAEVQNKGNGGISAPRMVYLVPDSLPLFCASKNTL